MSDHEWHDMPECICFLSNRALFWVSFSPCYSGLTQKEQIEVVKKFRGGGYNTLVATCVGEEGLDIGEIDLIVCYDVSKSPIRLVQRMGRTGRKRDGRIIVLVTEVIISRRPSRKGYFSS